jgi:hypothetical protein
MVMMAVIGTAGNAPGMPHRLVRTVSTPTTMEVAGATVDPTTFWT